MASLVTRDGRLLTRQGSRQGFAGGNLWSQSQWLDRDDDLSVAASQSYEQVYATSPVIGAAINKIVRQASRLPLKVYRRGDENAREHITDSDHPLVKCLGQPMPLKGRHDFKQWALLPLLIHGNSLLAKWRDPADGKDAPPRGLLPVDWRYVEAYAAQGGPVELWATTQTGEQRALEVDHVIHFAWQSGYGEIGVSPLKQLAETIRLEDASVRHQSATFRHGVRPSAAITPPPGTRMNDPDVRKFWRAQIDTLHKGVDQAGKVVLLMPGAKLDTFQMSAADAQLIESRYVNMEQAQMIFDLAGPLLADLRHGTYSNVEELNKQLFKSVLPPWLGLIEDTLQSQLIDPEPAWADLFVEFDAWDQVKGDPPELAQAIKTEIEAGVMTYNEGRRMLNLPPWGDPDDDDNPANKLMVAANNMRPIDEEPPEPVAAAPAQMELPTGPPTERTTPEPPAEA